ncbi:uncharacterized protein Smp_200280 [Schistosoma mansoni]|uniref:uncharacterized protein n=1 Tax=Schistosoma mansoni TaxID=6183 RepID=UPI00022DC913|nr:uncharacterized protein Smp_200280 [Schistosoma mansoni]|eukprot:XP_018647496.1 uncharacterized protein Smp_200280 [Schistosoma mansoni]
MLYYPVSSTTTQHQHQHQHQPTYNSLTLSHTVASSIHKPLRHTQKPHILCCTIQLVLLRPNTNTNTNTNQPEINKQIYINN